MPEAYRDDLAYIHDAGFGGVAQAAAAALRQSLAVRGVANGLVIDLGCGSGVLAQELTGAGYDVLGYDISRAMLKLARRRAPRARFVHGSCFEAEFPSCVALTAVGECFNYLFDPGNTDRALATLLRRAYESLVPGGLMMFDVAGPGCVRGGGLQRVAREGDGWAVLVTIDEDRQRMRLTREITSFRKQGRHYRRDRETHCIRLLDRSALREQLQEIGFRTKTLRGYGPLKFLPGRFGFEARKPG